MAAHIDNSNQYGALIGAVLVFVKKVYTSLSFIGTITWPEVIDAAILASVGAAAGFVITSLLKYLKRKLFKN